MQPAAGGHANYYATPELAAHYDADNADRDDFRFYLRLARDLASARVIDLGCGTGLLSSQLASYGHQVIGVEPQLTSATRGLPRVDHPARRPRSSP